jgi:hypothetical protein
VAGLFYPEMTNFVLPLHATREELIEIAIGWADEHDLNVSIERFFPDYLVGAVPAGGDVAAAIAEFEPVRRLSLRRSPFDIVATNQAQHMSMNPESFIVVLEPLSGEGLRATALTARMGDVEALRWWVGLAREAAEHMERGAWAVEPGGRRVYVPDHWHTPGAAALAADGVAMLSASGSATFEFDDLT